MFTTHSNFTPQPAPPAVPKHTAQAHDGLRNGAANARAALHPATNNHNPKEKPMNGKSFPLALAAMAGLALAANAAPQTAQMFWDFGPATSTTDFTADYSPAVTPPGAPFGVSLIGTGAYATDFGINASSARTPIATYGCNARLCVQRGNHAEANNAYFKWTLTPDSGVELAVTIKQFSHSGRKSSSGPVNWRFEVVTNNVAIILSSGSYAANDTWYPNLGQALNDTYIITAANPIEFRLYGYGNTDNGTLSAANWRIDDLLVVFDYENTGTVIPPTLSPPAVVAKAVSDSAIELDWNTVQTATGYYLDASTSPTFSGSTVQLSSCPATGSSGNLTLNEWTLVSSMSSGYAVLQLDESLTSPALDFMGVTSAQVSFQRRQYGSGTPDDLKCTLRVAVSTDGGANFVAATNMSTVINGAWQPACTVNLDTYCGQPSVILRFTSPNSTGNGSSSQAGVGLQNITVQGFTSAFLPNYDGKYFNGNSATNHTVTGLAENTTYYFRVRATDGPDISAPSATASAKTGITDQVPAAPVLSAAMAGLDAITVSWQAVAHATNTLFYASTNSTFTPCLAGYDGILASSPVVISGLSTNTYYFRAKSLGAIGDSAFAETSFELAAPVEGAFTVLYDFEKSAPDEYAPNITGNLGFFTASDVGVGGINTVGVGTVSGQNPTPHLVMIAANQPENFAGATAHITWTVEPLPGADGILMCVTNFSFRSRSSGTGPKSWRLVAECDNGPAVLLGYGENVMPTNQNWYVYGAIPNLTLGAENQIVFKLYGYYSSGAGQNNWRVDDIQIAGVLGDFTPPLPPPVLRASDVTTSSITVSWNEVARADGYRFDASHFATFETLLLPGSCMVENGNLNEWTMSPVVTPSISGAVLLFTNTATRLTSTEIDLTGITNAELTFNAQTFGGVVSGISSPNTIQIRVFDGSTYTYWEFVPANSTLGDNTANFPLAAFANKILTLEFSAPYATWVSVGNYRGAGVNNIRVQAAAESYIAPFHDFATNGTSIVVSGLAPNTTHHFRARSEDSTEPETSIHSIVLSVTTLDNTLAPVTGLDANPVKHNTATLLWDGHPEALNGYQIELYRTNATSRAGGPHVIITQLFKGSGENKVAQLTNIGDAPANLAQYDLRRNNGTGFGTAWPISTATPAHGATFTLAPGKTVLVVRNASTDPWISAQPALRMASLQFTDGNTVGLFHNGTHVDTAPTHNYTTYSRNSTVASGRVAVDFAEWVKTIIPGTSQNPFYGDYGLGEFTCSAPFFIGVTREVGALATSLPVVQLKPRLTYTFRIRALGDGAYSPWSYGEFTTLEPPKGTVLIIR